MEVKFTWDTFLKEGLTSSIEISEAIVITAIKLLDDKLLSASEHKAFF